MKIFFGCVNLWFLICLGEKIMCCLICWKKLASFVLTFMLGLFAVNFFQKEITVNNFQASKIQDAKSVKKNVYQGEGNGFCRGSPLESNRDPLTEKKRIVTRALKIISKPRANYTDIARQNNIQGTVTLRVTFLANRQIGNVSIVSGLPDGLTEQAMSAASKIEFKPQYVNGKPISVTKQVQYSFTIY